MRMDRKMNKNKNLIKFRPEWFEAYGLDKKKNFLQAPICECGCGNKMQILLDNSNDLFGFMFTVLMEKECNHCAIFAHAFDGNMYAALKVENETDDPVLFFGQKDNIEFFKEWDNEVNLHCYGLMIETRKGEWEIIED